MLVAERRRRGVHRRRLPDAPADVTAHRSWRGPRSSSCARTARTSGAGATAPEPRVAGPSTSSIEAAVVHLRAACIPIWRWRGIPAQERVADVEAVLTSLGFTTTETDLQETPDGSDRRNCSGWCRANAVTRYPGRTLLVIRVVIRHDEVYPPTERARRRTSTRPAPTVKLQPVVRGTTPGNPDTLMEQMNALHRILKDRFPTMRSSGERPPAGRLVDHVPACRCCTDHEGPVVAVCSGCHRPLCRVHDTASGMPDLRDALRWAARAVTGRRERRRERGPTRPRDRDSSDEQADQPPVEDRVDVAEDGAALTRPEHVRSRSVTSAPGVCRDRWNDPKVLSGGAAIAAGLLVLLLAPGSRRSCARVAARRARGRTRGGAVRARTPPGAPAPRPPATARHRPPHPLGVQVVERITTEAVLDDDLRYSRDHRHPGVPQGRRPMGAGASASP